MVLRGGGVRDAERGELRVAGNDVQEVVEVVRDAACQGADGLHLLGLAKLGLEALPLGDVAPDGRHADDGAAGVLDGGDAERNLYPGGGLGPRHRLVIHDGVSPPDPLQEP